MTESGAGGSPQAPRRRRRRKQPPEEPDERVTWADFWHHLPTNRTFFMPDRSPWAGPSVNRHLHPVVIGKHDMPILDGDGFPRRMTITSKTPRITATEWLAVYRCVEQLTWHPGMPDIIEDRLLVEGGWVDRPGARLLNLYRPPRVEPGDGGDIGPWLDLLACIYPDDVEHMLCWFAHRVQRPDQKCNHALVMGGAQGIGKDSLLHPIVEAVGTWNVQEVSPTTLMGRFNGFLKSVILRVSEARDLGDVSRYAFYDHAKVYTAAPPDVLRVDEKHLREYPIPNVCGVLITSNHKLDGLFIPPDDRRHYVAWSNSTRDDFERAYWSDLWAWYGSGGVENVASFLGEYDLSSFNPKAPPPQTDAWHDIVAANSLPEDAELSEALDSLDHPEAVTIPMLAGAALSESFADWLQDRRNSRQVPHRLEEAGYTAVRSPYAKAGRWRVWGRQVVIYARTGLTEKQRMTAAERLTETERPGVMVPGCRDAT